MTARIVLVRHGLHDRLGQVLCGRMAGVGLNAAGQAQAERLAAVLGGLNAAAVYTSPQLRARQTAETIAELCGLTVQKSWALDEIEFGEWTGARFADLDGQPAWIRWNEQRSQQCPPRGESMLAVQSRVADWMRQTLERHEDTVVVAVSHADVIKAAVCHATGLSLDHHSRLEVAPGTLTTIVVAPWGTRLLGLNAPA